MDEQRLVDIETKIAFQERIIKELNEVVYEQQKQIDHLNATCRHLESKIRESADMLRERDVIDEKPPHY